MVILISFRADNNEEDYNVKGCEMDQIQEIASKLRPPGAGRRITPRARGATRPRAHRRSCVRRARAYVEYERARCSTAPLTVRHTP